MKTLPKFALVLAAVASLAGCVSVPDNAGQDPSDPWETMNRNTFAFNQKLDTYVYRPVAKGYEFVVPEYTRERIGNIYVNLNEPANAINNALQGKGEGALVSLFRLMINTTLGLGGMYDVAGTAANQPTRREDFGQTLAVWGVGNGPYFVIPFLGPSTLRDAPSLGVDYLTAPQTWLDGGWAEWAAWGVFAMDYRLRMMPATDLLEGAVDPYLMAREAYLSTRRNAVYDGNPPLEFPEDEFEDELEDEATDTAEAPQQPAAEAKE